MSLPIIELSQTLARIVETVGASVVRISSHRRGSASGVVLSAHRVVSTSSGVVGDTVRIGIGEKEFTGTVRGRDESTDLVVIETVEALTPMAFETAAPPKVGTIVLQLARPGKTVRATSGIVMAANDAPFESRRGGTLSSYLETDAAHEQGFSGGPLVSLEGKVLGIASTRIIRERSVTIPAATILKVAEVIEKHGKVPQSWLGLEMQPVALPNEVQKATGEEVGLLVLRVSENGPAASAGLKYGDTVLHLGDDSVKTVHDVMRYLKADRVGQQVPVSVFRDGQVQKVAVTVAARP